MEEAHSKSIFDQARVWFQPSWEADLPLVMVPRVELKGRRATEFGSDP